MPACPSNPEDSACRTLSFLPLMVTTAKPYPEGVVLEALKCLTRAIEYLVLLGMHAVGGRGLWYQ